MDYKCSRCGASGIKLWRPWGYPAPLCCARCMGAHDFDGSGRRPFDYGTSDQCDDDEEGAMIPAVPAEVDGSFWSYHEVPEERVRWWRAMPTYDTRGAN